MYIEDDADNTILNVISAVGIVIIALCTIMELTVWKSEREYHQQIKHELWRSQFTHGAIKTNQRNAQGCERYQYYHSYYWECPDNKKIIEVRGRKGKITYEEVKK